MPVVEVYSTSTPSLSIPLNTASRTIFRFYSIDPNNNNQQIGPNLGVDSAQIIISPPDQTPITIDLTRQANGDFIFFLTANQLALDVGQYPYALFLDSDNVPFVSGTLSVGLTIQQDQFIEVWNASRNAILVNGNQYENPAFEDSETATLDVTTDGDGVATITVNLAAITQSQIYAAVKEILQGYNGINIVPDDGSETLTIEVA